MKVLKSKPGVVAPNLTMWLLVPQHDAELQFLDELARGTVLPVAREGLALKLTTTKLGTPA